jgi:hypothetical protein
VLVPRFKLSSHALPKNVVVLALEDVDSLRAVWNPEFSQLVAGRLNLDA